MPLIPNDEVERIKREVPIAELVREAGIELARHGAKDLAGRCRFHGPDETPSLVITPTTNLWHCFGCGAAGNVLQWEMRVHGIDFPEAYERLASRGRASAGACPFRVGMSDGEMLLAAVDHYHRTLLASAEALGYLERRGLRDDEVIERFQFGYADRSLGPLLPEKNRVPGAAIRGQAQGVGLWRESGHELFRGSLVIPVFDEAGQVVQMYGRKVNDNLRSGTPKHLYLPRPLQGVWNLEGVVSSSEVIVCEALLDAATLWRWGYRNVTASYGVEGFTESHWEVFGRCVERVLLAFDGDTGGDRGTERLAGELMAAGIECFRVPVPRGQDVNSFALSTADPRDGLGDLLRRAEWLGKGQSKTTVQAVPNAEPPLLAASERAADEQQPSAVVAPPPRAFEVACREEGDAVWFEFGDRVYRVRGLEKNTAMGSLRVSVLLVRQEAPHVDTLDLATDLNRQRFGKRAEEVTGAKADVVSRDLTRMFCKLEELQEARIREATAPKVREVEISEDDRAEALELLRDPGLVDRVLEDFERCGIVGERTNKMMGYLAAVSRKLDDPLAVLIQSSSAAGKTSLMDAVLAFVPDEDRVKYSAVTGQSLFYMSETDLKHKVLALVEEEGAERASYALKLLQSEGELTIASTGKDPQTGRLVTHEYRVEGPVALLLTTTAAEIDEELQNRCIVLTVDEDREQTRLIHRQQRERWTLEGLAARKRRDRVLAVHRNAQRLLKPLAVHIPWVRRLTFLDTKTRTRRDHDKYLVLIAVITLLHQQQRETGTMDVDGETVRYIEATLEDIALANRLAAEVLGRSLDELAPQTRRLLMLIDEMVEDGCERLKLGREQYRFTQRQIREHAGWNATQTRVHLQRLVDMEYVLAHRTNRGQQVIYEVIYDGQGKGGEAFVIGLADVEGLKGAGRTGSARVKIEGARGESGGCAESARGGNGAETGGAQEDETVINPSSDAGLRASESEGAKNAYLDRGVAVRSYRSHRRAMPAAGGE